MPNIKSAEKRVLVNRKKSSQNRSAISEMKTAIKKFNSTIDVNNIEEAERLLPITMSIIDSTAAKGMIHKNNAANKKSALSKRLSDIKSGKVVVEVKKDNKTIAAEKAKAAQDARDNIKKEILRKKEETAVAKAKAAQEKLEAEKLAKKSAKSKSKKDEEPKEEKPKAKKSTEKEKTETKKKTKKDEESKD